jgi:hypothetical protein
MPFTPFHLGPGAAFKAIGGERFSFMIFGGSQVLMDIEPLVRMMRGDAVLHGLSHTIAGALAVALASAVIGRPISNLVLRHFGMGDHPIGWITAFVSASIGTYSHIGLDAVMHRDMRPFWPIGSDNGLLGIIPIGTLHLLCLLSGLLGGGVVIIRMLRHA